ncbi:MAG: TetR/AcrR family transcriptional regulator [Actinomycetota bacterium]|nr:TetR/AcrR family transcriptional regulator [Actinomycetota bacterium]
MATTEKGPLRRGRQRDLIAATRALFDERGMQDAPIEEIAKSVGIARGLIYREFSSKEELFVAAVTDYLRELEGELDAAERTGGEDVAARLQRTAETFAGFCERYPAFLDSSLALMRRPAGELNKIVSEEIWLRLGQGMANCIDHVARILRVGVERGELDLADPELTANLLWTQILGAMHLARIRVGMRRTQAGLPELFTVEPSAIVRACAASALATAGVEAPAPKRA